MAEKTVLVCDVCGNPATQSATIKVGTRNFLKDLCAAHLGELLNGTRRPKRGRKPGTTAGKRRTRAKAQTAAPKAKARSRRARRKPEAEVPATA
jgi:hypothetical protein